MVLYGYTDLSRSGGVVEQLRARFPTLDYGMGLVGQMSMVLAIKTRAERLPGRRDRCPRRAMPTIDRSWSAVCWSSSARRAAVPPT